MIINFSPSHNLALARSKLTAPPNVLNAQKDSAIVTNPKLDGVGISTLSRQLSESLARATIRDKTLSKSDLSFEAERILRQILDDTQQSADNDNSKNTPTTKSPELLDRARQAADYVASSDRHDRSGTNPFNGLSRELLNAIIYDEAGAYTINERRAAYYAVFDIEREWRCQARGILNAESFAKVPNNSKFYIEVLVHYRSLPTIEKARYPDDYEARLEAAIKNPGKPEKPLRYFTLVEMLAAMQKSRKLAGSNKEKPGATHDTATVASASASSGNQSSSS